MCLLLNPTQLCNKTSGFMHKTNLKKNFNYLILVETKLKMKGTPAMTLYYISRSPKVLRYIRKEVPLQQNEFTIMHQN